jgi:hypothetical protein
MNGGEFKQTHGVIAHHNGGRNAFKSAASFGHCLEGFGCLVVEGATWLGGGVVLAHWAVP